MDILITGFEANDQGLNASKLAIEYLRDTGHPRLAELEDCIAYEVMPPSSARLKPALLDILGKQNPRCCVFVGQAPGRDEITFECFATNLKEFRSPDGDGNQPQDELIEADGPAAYWSSLPRQQLMIEQLNSKGIPASFSNHAGNHLCNQLLYHGLHHVATTGIQIRCGFVHVPLLPSQAAEQWSDTPSMSLEMTTEALAIVLYETARHEMARGI